MEKFWYFLLVLEMLYFTGSGLGFILSTLMPNLELAMAISPSFFIPLNILGGLYINPNSIPTYFKVFEYISPFKFSFSALA